MLKITIPSIELYDEVRNEFTTTKACELQLEHSLVSLSKWESKWKKPFLVKNDKTMEETLDYIRCMTINPNVPDEVYSRIPSKVINEIQDYIADPMTATTFNNSDNKSGTREVITSEMLYFSMIALNIPFECQKWHLNRLITLIRICNLKNTPPKKMSKRDIASRNAALNAERRQALGTRG